MKMILKRLWNDPVYLGSVSIAAVGLGASYFTGLSAEIVGSTCALIAVATGAEYARREAKK